MWGLELSKSDSMLIRSRVWGARRRGGYFDVLEDLRGEGFVVAGVDDANVRRVFNLHGSDGCPEHSLTAAAGIAWVC